MAGVVAMAIAAIAAKATFVRQSNIFISFVNGLGVGVVVAAAVLPGGPCMLKC